MPDRIDRRTGNGTILLVIVVLAVMAAGGVWWLRGTRPSSIPIQMQSSSGSTAAMAPLTITLFLPREGGLSGEPVSLTRLPDSQSLAKEALNAVFADTRTQQAPVLRDFKLRAFFLDDSGTAHVDLTPHAETAGGSAWEEMLALYAIVDTLTQNFEEIKQVHFLVDGRETQALAGHIDLLRMFTKRMDLVK